ncbi:MAG: PQQ-dependent sugar dehydrogenase [Blastocatellia bacterium]
MRKVLLAFLFFMLIAILCFAVNRAAAEATARQEITAIPLVPVLTGLSSPVYVTNAHDGSNRLFIVEQPGRIKVLQPNASAPTVFLDITSRVQSGGEQGLLGLAFHPQFSTNGRFFVDYTRRPDGATVIAEYAVSANANVALMTERTLLVIPQPFANHNGGMIEFGPDDYLYIGMGDGGSANDPGNRAQNLNELLGKILRIDVDHSNGSQPYSSPADNPFFGSVAGRDEIYAYGLRNPWRFSFDRSTGELYVADVGQGAREEVDIVRRGGNYGWRIMEGSICTNLDSALCSAVQVVPPIAEYSHTGGRCSISGGYVYRGTRGSLPAAAYVYGDYCTGEIFLLKDGASTLIDDTALNITSFGEDEAGEIYVVGQGGTVDRLGNAAVPAPTFAITRAVVRKRASGAALDPLSVRPNGKKFDIVVYESGTTPTAASMNATVMVNGAALDTEYTTTEAGEPIFVARLRRGMLATPGPLTVEVVRGDGSRSNTLTLQVVAAP